MKSANNQKINIPFFSSFLYPFQNISNNFIKFLQLTILFTLITTLSSFILGRSYACAINLDKDFCSFIPFNAIFSIIIYITCFSLYINRWNILSSTDISLKETFAKPYLKKDLKAFSILLINTLALSILGGCIYLLNQRKVTPNFNLELGLFILFSIFIIFAILIFLNNVLLLRFLNSKKITEINKTLWPIFDNIYKYFLWFLLYFLFFAIILKNLFYNLAQGETVFAIIKSEFFLNFIIYTMISFWISNLQYQEKLLFKE